MNIEKCMLLFVLMLITLSCTKSKETHESNVSFVGKRGHHGVFVDIYTQE